MAFAHGRRDGRRAVSLPNLPLSVPTYYVVAPAECSSNLSRFDGVRFGHRCDDPRDLTDLYKRSRGEGFGAEVKRRIMTGTYVLSAGYYDAYYLKAQKVRSLINADFRRAFAEVDVLMGPTAPTPAFAIGAKTDDPIHDVPERHLHDRREPGGTAGGLRALRPRRTACRSACRSSARTSRRSACSRPRTPGSARRTGIAGVPPSSPERRHEHRMGNRHRPRDPRAARDALEDLLGLVDRLRRDAERAGEPRRSRLSRRAAGAESRGGAHGRAFGLAIGATIARRSIFARKNYFYPDLPKGYQISQYERPIVEDGRVAIVLEDGTTKTIGVTRAHLEEDAGKSLHEGLGRHSGIDLNRAGTPLLEIVSEPDMRSAREAIAYMKKIHTLVRYLEICDGNMQEGSFRCDANVSVRHRGRHELRHALRDQEPELLPLRRARDQLRGRAPDRAARRRRQRRAGNAAVRLRIATRRARCGARRKRTTTATSRIRTCCRWRSTKHSSRKCAAGLPELPDAEGGAIRARARALAVRRGRADGEPRTRGLSTSSVLATSAARRSSRPTG